MIPAEIDVHPAAVTEARQAYRWYLRRSAQAASRFQAWVAGAERSEASVSCAPPGLRRPAPATLPGPDARSGREPREAAALRYLSFFSSPSALTVLPSRDTITSFFFLSAVSMVTS